MSAYAADRDVGPSVAFSETAPPEHLAEFVGAFWERASHRGTVRHVVVPDGCVDLVLKRYRQHTAAVAVGPATTPVEVALESGVTYLGVRFHPWVGAPMLGLTGDELLDRTIALAEILPGLNRSIERSKSTDSMELLATLATELVGRRSVVPSQLLVRDTYALLGETEQPLGVAEMSRELGVSERSLRRAFQLVVGSGPKTAARVLRLRSALSKLERGELAARVALDCGYADQAHMTHEITGMTGSTPREIARKASTLAEIYKRPSSDSDTTGS